MNDESGDNNAYIVNSTKDDHNKDGKTNLEIGSMHIKMSDKLSLRIRAYNCPYI